MSAAHDRKFFDTFMLVLGILAAVTIGLMVLAGIINRNTAAQYHQEDPLRQQETLERIAPVAKVAVAGKDNTALARAGGGAGGRPRRPARRRGLQPGLCRVPRRRRGGRTEDGRQGGLGSAHRAGRRTR